MLLVIDIGNTNISMALYKGDKILSHTKLLHTSRIDKHFLSKALVSAFGQVNLSGCMISSVVDELTMVMYKAVADTYKINAMILNSELNIGIKLKTKYPKTIGSDRLANIYAASKLYHTYPLVVIDSGSATTFDILDKKGDFIGGVIIPGFSMQLQSLHDHTSKLPEIEIDNKNKVNNIICATTKTQILSGIIRGHVCSIEGLLECCKVELGERPFVVITGGGADIIKEYMRKDKYDVINPLLTLEGTKLLYERTNN